MYNMKKFTLILLSFLALGFNVKAQQYVSTEPANRNVILEEYTGRNCGYCTDGHKRANQIIQAHPGRVWAINIHYGGLSPTTYPNLNLPAINGTLANGFPHDGIPTGVVNRSTPNAVDRGQWSNQTIQQLALPAECNVAGIARINPDTRIATIEVEVYYTGNSSVSENYLTVVMLQDSILGAQSDYGNYNPEGWLNGQYVHGHALRDIITPGIWGESISPTTQGTLITKTYEYQIPQSIGDPNGVEVKLQHIHFIAFVTERYQGTPTRPVLNACELAKTTMSNEPIYPMVNTISQTEGASCSHVQTFNFGITNIGTEELTSMRFNAVAGDVTTEFEWTGNLASGEKMESEFDMDLPFGSFNGSLNIIEANGEPYDYQSSFTAECLEWAEVSVEDEEFTSLKVYVIQDQFGEQVTWDIINSANEVIASGGPYQHLIGSGSTQPNIQNIENVPVNDCYLFRIHDSNGNGICCNFGNGYYYVKDGNGDVIFGGEGNGNFGEQASHLFSILNPNAVSVITSEPTILGDHEAMFVGSLTGTASEIGFEYKKLVDPTPYTVVGELDGKVFTAIVDDLELNTMYSVKAFAIVGGTKIYGDEVHFHTWVEGVSELEKSLKVYPNPANDFLNVEGEMTSVEVYNTVGQCLISKQVNGDTKIDLSGFNNGIYFLRVHNNGEMAVRKFSVNR